MIKTELDVLECARRSRVRAYSRSGDSGMEWHMRTLDMGDADEFGGYWMELRRSHRAGDVTRVLTRLKQMEE